MRRVATSGLARPAGEQREPTRPAAGIAFRFSSGDALSVHHPVPHISTRAHPQGMRCEVRWERAPSAFIWMSNGDRWKPLSAAASRRRGAGPSGPRSPLSATRPLAARRGKRKCRSERNPCPQGIGLTRGGIGCRPAHGLNPSESIGTGCLWMLIGVEIARRTTHRTVGISQHTETGVLSMAVPVSVRCDVFASWPAYRSGRPIMSSWPFHRGLLFNFAFLGLFARLRIASPLAEPS